MPNIAMDDTDVNNAGSMSRLDVIRLVGDVLTELDMVRAKFDRATDERKKLDNLRDGIDTEQRKMVRNVIKENTEKFSKRAAALKAINEDVLRTIKEVDRFIETVRNLVRFLEAVQKIAELAF